VPDCLSEENRIGPWQRGIGVSTATCDIRFSLQNRYAEDGLVNLLTKLGISNRAVTISGRATRSEKEISRTDFIGANAEEIRTRLTDFLEKHALPCDNDLVILDMEPEDIAPRHLGEFEDDKKLQRALIASYRRRIRVARQVLRQTKRPGLKLGLYQVIVPDGKGRSSAEFEQRMRGYREAGEQGMYDQLDFICPVLYQRFGSDDAAPETLRKWISAASRQGIDESLTLTRKNGTQIPLVPLLSFWVFNGNSDSDRDAVQPKSVARQLRIVQDAVGVEAIVFGQRGRQKTRCGRPKSRSSRSSSPISYPTSARCPGRGARERPDSAPAPD
jgi:hypothetical protein